MITVTTITANAADAESLDAIRQEIARGNFNVRTRR